MNERKKDIILTLLKAAIAMTLFAVAIIKYDELSTLDVRRLADLTDNKQLMAVLVLAVYLLKSMVFVVPASLVYVAVGVMFEPWIAVLINMTGIVLEVAATYLLGRFLGGGAVRKMLMKKEKGRKLLEKDIQNKPSLIIGVRAVPAFPIDFVSLFLGASQCPFPKYMLCSVLGISWRVIAFTILGSELFDWIPMDKIVLIVICCIPIGVAVYLYKKFKKPKTAAAPKDLSRRK